jgi:hypothetical protein
MTFSKMDLKAWIRKPDDDSQAYRFECFSCEFYRWHVMGGLVIDGVKERHWHCVFLIYRRSFFYAQQCAVTYSAQASCYARKLMLFVVQKKREKREGVSSSFSG